MIQSKCVLLHLPTRVCNAIPARDADASPKWFATNSSIDFQEQLNTMPPDSRDYSLEHLTSECCALHEFSSHGCHYPIFLSCHLFLLFLSFSTGIVRRLFRSLTRSPNLPFRWHVHASHYTYFFSLATFFCSFFVSLSLSLFPTGLSGGYSSI